MTQTLDPTYGQNADGQYDYNGISTDPSLATNWYPTEQAAQGAWFSANPQYGSDPSSVYGNPNSSAAPVQTPVALSAATTTGGNTTASGLPTASAVASDAPLPIQDFGNLPSVSPTYSSYAAQVGPNLIDPNQSGQYAQTAYSENAAALAPTFQQQQQNLQDSDAARGISSSGAAAQLQGNLLGQQSATLAGADEPITAQGYGYSQADLVGNQAAQIGTGEFNSGQQQQVNLTNTGAANQATGVNANYYADALASNAGSYNNYLNEIENQGYNTGNEGYGAYLNSYLPNSGVQTTIGGAESAGTTGYNTAYGAAQGASNAALGAAGNAFGNIATPGLGAATNSEQIFGSGVPEGEEAVGPSSPGLFGGV
jgi:hypothetical protein